MTKPTQPQAAVLDDIDLLSEAQAKFALKALLLAHLTEHVMIKTIDLAKTVQDA